MERWYFAYGSNMLTDQMVSRIGRIQTSGERRTARLPNYRLVFNMLDADGNYYANIVQPGDGVHGVVYRCGQDTLLKLDVFEDGYERQEVVVVDNTGVELHAVIYIARPEHVVAHGQPSAAYLRKILAGAREHGLPENYIHAISVDKPTDHA